MAKGINSRALVKKQGTYGSGTTFTTSGMYEYPFTSEGFDVAVDEKPSNNMSNSRAESTLLFNGKKAIGSIAGDAYYTRLDHLLAAMMGLPTTVVGAAGDVGAFTNTYAPLTTTPPMFDWAINKGGIPSAHPYYNFSGMKEKKLVLSWKDRGPVSFASDWTGYNEISANPAGADAPTSDVTLVKDPILCGSNMTVIDVGTGASLAYCLKGATINIEQPLSEDDYCNGSDTPAEPDFDGFLQVTGELLVKFTDRLLYNDFLARTDLTAEFKFVSTSLVVGGGTLFRTLDILVNKMRYTKALALIDTPGLIIARVGFKAYGDAGSGATAQPIAFKTINEVKGDTLL